MQRAYVWTLIVTAGVGLFSSAGCGDKETHKTTIEDGNSRTEIKVETTEKR